MNQSPDLLPFVPRVARRSPPASGNRDERGWLLLVLILGFGVVLYVCRQQLSVLFTTLQKDFGLTTADFAVVVPAFMIAFMIGAPLMGVLCCLIGTRWTYGIIIAGSLIGTVITGLANSMPTLIVGRVVLGLVAGGGMPAAIQAVGECVPRKSQAIAVALLTIPILCASLLAAPAVVFVSLELGWRAVFFITAGVCFFWLLLWGALTLWTRQAPSDAVPVERITDGFGALTKWQSWAYVGARLLVDPLYAFLILWAPQYMMRAFGWPLADVSYQYVVLGMAGVAGALLGGLGSDIFALVGLKLSLTRSILLAMSGVGMVFGIIGGGFVRDANVFIVFMAIGSAAYQSLLINLHASLAGAVSSRGIGIVVGIGVLLGGALTVGISGATGGIVDRFGMMPTFVGFGLMAVFGSVFAFLVGWGLRAAERPTSTG